MRVGIDLLWIRPNQVGGIESCVRNLLDGLSFVDQQELEFVLFVSQDNANTFEKYKDNDIFEIVLCNILSSKVTKRIIWQNMFLGKTLVDNQIDVCLEPYYCKPFVNTRKVKFITIIHDLQAIHYPEYFSKLKVMWMKFNWKSAIKTSHFVVAISKFVRADIISHYYIEPRKIKVIYDAINLKEEDILPINEVEVKYSIQKYCFYFTVSSLLLHKNLKTLIYVMRNLKNINKEFSPKLIISGVGGKNRNELERLIVENNLIENIIITQYISDSERNTLYKYCKAFLFPSIFEGFGMPPIEAMYFGTPVITTRRTSIPEVTQNKALYVNDPFDVDNWVDVIMKCPERFSRFDISCYSKEMIAAEYVKIFLELDVK